jgi:hypothetical protein
MTPKQIHKVCVELGIGRVESFGTLKALCFFFSFPLAEHILKHR